MSGAGRVVARGGTRRNRPPSRTGDGTESEVAQARTRACCHEEAAEERTEPPASVAARGLRENPMSTPKRPPPSAPATGGPTAGWSRPRANGRADSQQGPSLSTEARELRRRRVLRSRRRGRCPRKGRKSATVGGERRDPGVCQAVACGAPRGPTAIRRLEAAPASAGSRDRRCARERASGSVDETGTASEPGQSLDGILPGGASVRALLT